MIQRTERTEEKRDGKVVCLVAENSQEEARASSKSATRILMNDWEKCTAFHFDSKQCKYNSIIFQTQPKLEYTKLNSSSAVFDLSQVGWPGKTTSSITNKN